MHCFDPFDIPLGGHGGLLDTLNQALTAAGAELAVLDAAGTDPQAMLNLRARLETADAVSTLAREALDAGATREQRQQRTPTPAARTAWAARVETDDFTPIERQVLSRTWKSQRP